MSPSKLAPIVLFVYNRPEHTKRTVESLLKNTLAEKSTLMIFSDGAKNDVELEELKTRFNIYLNYPFSKDNKFN